MCDFDRRRSRVCRGRRALLGAISTVVIAGMSAIWHSPSSAQTVGGFSVEAERLFERGLEAYGKGAHDKARGHFEKLRERPVNQRSSAGLLMLARTLFHLGLYEEARQVTRRLEREFESSRYGADASLITGDAFYQEQRFFEAARRYVRILGTPSPLRVQASAAERLAAIVKNGDIDPQGVDRLRDRIGSALLQDALLYGEARWYDRLGWRQQSRDAKAAYLRVLPDGVFAPLVRGSVGKEPRTSPPIAVSDPVDTGLSSGSRVLSPPSRLKMPWPTSAQVNRSRVSPLSLTSDELVLSIRPRIGIIQPLSGDQFPSAQEVLDGIKMANDEMGRPFDLLLADTGQDFGTVPINQSEPSRLIHTVKVTEELISRWGVVALIGPLFSTSCAAAASVAEAAGVPLISPLAQQSGLDSLGQYIFQLRTVPEVQGQVLAEYATLVLGLQTFAVLSPLTDYGWNFERAFVASARANGGAIVHSDWYTPGATDYQAQFDAIRKAGFELEPAPSVEDSMAVLDSLSQAVLDTSLTGDGLFWEMVGENEFLAEPPDSTEMFIYTIDGMVVVVERFDDAEVIAPQIPFKRFDTQVLGNDLWYDPEALMQMEPRDRDTMENTIIVSGRDLKGEEATRFTASFRRQFEQDPGYAVYGYDAAKILGHGWDAGHRTRDGLRSWLSALRGYDGASGRISFSRARRVNGELILLKIDAKGQIRPLDSEDLPTVQIPDEELPEADMDLDYGYDLDLPLSQPQDSSATKERTFQAPVR